MSDAKDDNFTVSRLYDTLKSPTFLKNLYWDILSGIKEKNTYKFMRGMAEKLINQNMEVLNGLNNTEDDNIRRKKIVAEICAMSYAIDTVFSKILFFKLENACKGQIRNIIQQLRNEGKIPENVWSKFKIKTEAPEPETSTENSDTAHQKREVKKIPTRVGKRKRKVNSNYFHKDAKKANSNEEILEDLRKVNGVKESDKDEKSANNKKENFPRKKLGGRIKEFSKKNAPSPKASTSLQKLTKENVSLLNSVDEIAEKSSTLTSKDSLQTDNQDASDAESEISLIASVSSVHTSDLSSFDDEISLSSDDDNGEKKRLSLKEVQKKFRENDKLDSSIAEINDTKSSESVSQSIKLEEKPDQAVEKVKKKKKRVSLDETTKSITESPYFQSLVESGLSKRARKPNSRYSSDNILCTVVKVKERKKTTTLNKTYGKMSSDESSPQRKKSKIDHDIIGDVATINQAISNEESYNNTSDVKTPAAQPETSDLYKSHSANRSLTSRRTAPVTLFST